MFSLFVFFTSIVSFASPPAIRPMLHLNGNSGYVMEGNEFGYSVHIDFQNASMSYRFHSGGVLCEQAEMNIEVDPQYSHINVLEEIRVAAEGFKVKPFFNDVIAADCGLDAVSYTRMRGTKVETKSAVRTGMICLQEGNTFLSGEADLISAVEMAFTLNSKIEDCAKTNFQKHVKK